MAKLVYGLSQSLDGYVDHTKLGPPAPAAFPHFIEQVRGLTGLLYGRRMYEIMRYWDEDLPDWGAEERDFAVVWRSLPKWVVSRSLKSVGHNATLVTDDFEIVIRKLKDELLPDEELTRAKDQLKGNILMGLESSNSRMANLARQEIYFGQFFSADEIIARIDAVQASQVQQMAQRRAECGWLTTRQTLMPC